MVVIRKRGILDALALLGVLIGIAAVSIAFMFLEGWMIHKYIPDVEQLPWYWNYHMAPAFSPSESGRSVLVDLDALTLTVYKDGEVEKTFPCSGGKKSTPSPLGQWQTTYEGDWGEGFGGSWIAINCPWGKFGIHGTVEPWTIGKVNASHGCIRMLNSDVAELKKMLGWGTPVYIKYDGVPFRAMKSGMTGSDVVEVQELLRDLGYTSFEPDGVFGVGTEAAVKKFQNDHGMYADGVVGWGTIEALRQTQD